MAARKTFSTAAHTQPTAEESLLPTAAGTTPVAESITYQEPSKPSRPNQSSARTSFSWRQTRDQEERLDRLMILLRHRLGLGRGKLPIAVVLDTLVQLADEREDVRAMLLDRLGTGQRS